MNYRSVSRLFFGTVLVSLSVIAAFAQTNGDAAKKRPRVVNPEDGPRYVALPKTTPTPVTAPTPTPAPAPGSMQPIVITPTQRPAYPTPTPYVRPAATPTPTPSIIFMPRPGQIPTQTPPIVNAQDFLSERVLPEPVYNGKVLTLNQIRAHISEAKMYMQTRPLLISSVQGVNSLTTDTVRIAAIDPLTLKMHYILVAKPTFLSKNTQFFSTTSEGRNVTVRIVRANGVNTAVTVIDDRNQSLLPLIAQYPVERDGRFYETAYYSSAHPGTITAEVAYAGKMYIHNIIDGAREKLREKGIYIAPRVADIAERLATVEHVDHQRFNTEFQLNIYNEIFTLFALNEGQTYRYAVSTAGAGGLVQMIPSTYRMVMNRHFNVGLMPNFVDGMRNHPNAAQAMLLYMQDTWNDLSASPTVLDAMASGIATQPELMSAGYNSNPARLPGYIKRGGANWKNLIPRETQIYHRIYASLDRFVPMTPRAK